MNEEEKVPDAACARPHCFSYNEESINCMFRQRFEPNALLITADCTFILWSATCSSSFFLSLVGFCLFVCLSISLSCHNQNTNVSLNVA